MASEMFVEKKITINQSLPKLFDYLKMVKSQEDFSVWNRADPNKNVSSEGTDGTVGFVYRWDSTQKNVGAGSQTITEIEKNTSISYTLQFERPMKSVGYSKFQFKEISPQETEVSWSFKSPLKFPMSLFKGKFQKMIGKDLEKSMENLKQFTEK